MMRWKTRKATTNIGVLNFGNVTFDEDEIQISIDISEMSEELKLEINKTIELEKCKFTEDWNRLLSEHEECKRFSTVWGKKPVVIDFNYLAVELRAEKPVKYVIVTGFHDADNDRLDTACYTEVDLTAYTEELKKAIIHVLIDRFF
ncbi:hypothetical protein [Lacrimispora sp.]|uniref:hypothetical protein n=1 Tax=Lacrimispora sp. TaxID=2719234 RepID=UPI0028A92FF2|nr:hypothetical protein [Lacrimispora sp.]